TPIYRADALLQIEQDAQPFGGLTELMAMTGEAPVAGGVEIIRSRSVLGGAIERLDLQTVVSPAGWFAGGEAVGVGVGRLSVPEELMGERLRLEARGDGKYVLSGPNGLALSGQVGVAASAGEVSVFE